MAKLSLIAVTGMVLLAPGITYSQTYPSRPIRIIVPNTAGSAQEIGRAHV